MPHDLFKRIRLHRLGFKSVLSKGECFEQGKFVEKNIDIAIWCYEEAIREGDTNGYFKLGRLCEQRNELDRAINLYLTGAMKANLEARADLLRLVGLARTEAEYAMGLLCEHEHHWEEARDWYRRVTLKPETKQCGAALYQLGTLCQSDRLDDRDHRIVILRDLNEALSCYARAVRAGSSHALDALVRMAPSEAQASFHLAQLYETGGPVGPRKDMTKAIERYEKAVDSGSKDAAVRLGQLYEAGEQGVDRNFLKACQYYLTAIKHNGVEAITPLERLLEGLNDSALESDLANAAYYVLKQKPLALKWFKKAILDGSANVAQKLSAIATSDAEFIYRLAESYRGDGATDEDLQRAIHYYLIAAQNNHAEAKNHLEHLAAEGSVNAQYVLGVEYYHRQNNFLEAAKWCMKAAERNYPQAKAYLTTTKFSANVCWQMGCLYEEGKWIPKNIFQALIFYTKASELGDKNASFHLAQFYQEDHEGIPNNPENVFKYYIQALNQGHSEALMVLTRLATEGSANVQYFLGATYYHRQNNFLEAAKWCMKAAEQDHVQAKSYLASTKFSAAVCVQIAHLYEQGEWVCKDTPRAITFYVRASDQGDKNASFYLAQFYETDHDEMLKNPEKAFKYYAQALNQGHPGALGALTRLAIEGNANVQYFLGAEYYHRRNNFLEATKWCMKAAEQGHQQAKSYLLTVKFSKEVYLRIAHWYEQGEGVRQNVDQAAIFYAKAGEVGDQNASVHLAQLYDVEHNGSPRDPEKAFQYTVQALKQGYVEAVTSLERLAEEIGAGALLELGHLYRSPLLNNPQKALHCYQRAMEEGSQEAQRFLSLPGIANTQNSNTLFRMTPQPATQGWSRRYQQFDPTIMQGIGAQNTEELAAISVPPVR